MQAQALTTTPRVLAPPGPLAQIRKQYVDEAYAQMFLSKKRRSRLVRDAIRKAANLADIRYELKPDQLRVAQAYVGKGPSFWRYMFMGRGARSLAASRTRSRSPPPPPPPPPTTLARPACPPHAGRIGLKERGVTHLFITLEEAPQKAREEQCPKRPKRVLSHQREQQLYSGQSVATMYGLTAEGGGHQAAQ